MDLQVVKLSSVALGDASPLSRLSAEKCRGWINGCLKHCFGLPTVSKVDNPLRRGF
jgi:hypothetical protein